LANIGRIAEGLRLTEQGLETYRGLKTPPVFWPLLLHLCAGAYGAASRPEDGLPLLDEALASEKSGSSDGLASEFLILKGDLLGALSSDNTVEAESLYRSALDNARAGSAAMVELRAAMRLSRLWQSRGRPEQARELLIAAYSKISEGFTTADMKDARALLDTLSS
jgi:adenylate cyclase